MRLRIFSVNLINQIGEIKTSKQCFPVKKFNANQYFFEYFTKK